MSREEGASPPGKAAAQIDQMLERARARYSRLTPADASAAQAGGALLVDTRSEAQRRRGGSIPGALTIERNHLEWRLDPTSPNRVPEIHDHDQQVIVICAQGYSSSLAAASLLDLGLARATDVIGGFEAWAQAGMAIDRS